LGQQERILLALTATGGHLFELLFYALLRYEHMSTCATRSRILKVIDDRFADFIL
jgi:hypothetical protein